MYLAFGPKTLCIYIHIYKLYRQSLWFGKKHLKFITHIFFYIGRHLFWSIKWSYIFVFLFFDSKIWWIYIYLYPDSEAFGETGLSSPKLLIWCTLQQLDDDGWNWQSKQHLRNISVFYAWLFKYMVRRDFGAWIVLIWFLHGICFIRDHEISSILFDDFFLSYSMRKIRLSSNHLI